MPNSSSDEDLYTRPVGPQNAEPEPNEQPQVAPDVIVNSPPMINLEYEASSSSSSSSSPSFIGRDSGDSGEDTDEDTEAILRELDEIDEEREQATANTQPTPSPVRAPNSSASLASSSPSSEPSPPSSPAGIERVRLTQVQCRLCVELNVLRSGAAMDLYEHNPEYRNFYLPTSSSLCACSDNSRVHVFCLQRWTRLTADKPCSKCRCHFSAPSHLTRLDTFGNIMSMHYALKLALSLWFVNMWMLKDLFWLIVSEWQDRQFYFKDDLSTLSWVCGSVRWTTLLLYLVPFMNLLVLNYFYLIYRSRRIDLALIEFSYHYGRVEATQLYSSQMVAEYYIRRSMFMPSVVNYGHVYSACSWCGKSLVNEDNDHYLRYICGCYGIHRDCFSAAVRLSPSPGQASRCPNCGQHFSSVKMFLRCVRDVICSKFVRAKPIGKAIWQMRHFSLPRREPSFARYVLFTKLGTRKLVKFCSVLALYLTIEFVIATSDNISSDLYSASTIGLSHLWCYVASAWSNSFWWSKPQGQPKPESSLANVDTQAFSGLQAFLHQSLPLRVAWFGYEFIRLGYQAYLDDFERHQSELQSRIII